MTGGVGGDFLLVVGATAAGFLSSYLTNRRSNKTDKKKTLIDEGKLELDGRREDGAAYERANRINQEIVESLRAELTALQATIGQLRGDLVAEQNHSAQLESRIRDLEASASSMRRLLNDAGIEYSP